MTEFGVVIIDDEPAAVRRLELLLKQFEAFSIITTSNKAENAIKIITENKPDLIFIDIEMPGISGLEIAEKIAHLNVKVIFATGHEHYAKKAIRVDAFDYLTKPIDIDELNIALERFVRSFLKVPPNQPHHLPCNLSEREIQIILLLSKGFNSEETAEKLFLSRHTIDTHRRKILKKTNSKNTAELIRFANLNGMI